MNAIAQQDITVVDDFNAAIEPGMFVATQIGNRLDTSWSPAAPVLILHTNAVFFGGQQFTGLYQRSPGEYYIARFIAKHTARELHENTHQTGQKVGVLYCTSGVPVDIQTFSSPHLTPEENRLLSSALQFHRKKIGQLPVALRYRKDKQIDPAKDHL